jgi:hypothetical protein
MVWDVNLQCTLYYIVEIYGHVVSSFQYKVLIAYMYGTDRKKP